MRQYLPDALPLTAKPIGAAAKKRAYRGFAETWVARAITGGCDPCMRQEPLLSEGYAGEWLLVVSAAGFDNPLYPGRLPERFLDEVFLILGRLGRIKPDAQLRPWHGNVLLDDDSPRAIAFRVKLIRQSLNMECEEFYGAVGIRALVGEALESDHLAFARPDKMMLQAIALHYDAPEEWLCFGAAEEIGGDCAEPADWQIAPL